MGKVHALIIQQLAEAEKAERPASQETTKTATGELASLSSELADTENQVDPDLKPADVSADLVMGHFTAEGPIIPDAPNPAPDEAGETVSAVVPSQLDGLSSASDGPVTRLEFQTLAAQVAIVEAWIKRHGSKI